MAARALKGAMGARRGLVRPPKRDYSAASARASVENSLRALGTDCLDILYLHEPELELLGDTEPLVRTLEALKAAGKVRHVGLSGQAAECDRIAVVHPALSEVLQLEVPRDPEGLPAPGVSGHTSAVSFWEFAAYNRAGLQPELCTQIIQRLYAANHRGILMVSTKSVTELQATVESFEKMESAAARSATSTLA
jgi:hypothetical protein